MYKQLQLKNQSQYSGKTKDFWAGEIHWLQGNQNTCVKFFGGSSYFAQFLLITEVQLLVDQQFSKIQLHISHPVANLWSTKRAHDKPNHDMSYQPKLCVRCFLGLQHIGSHDNLPPHQQSTLKC